MSEAEAQLSHLQDIPVAIYHNGVIKNQTEVGIDVVIFRDGDTHFVTAKEVKEIILNEKVSPVPTEMRTNPDSCQLILCRDNVKTVIPDGERINDYGKDLAQSNASLAISDAKCDLTKLAVKTK